VFWIEERPGGRFTIGRELRELAGPDHELRTRGVEAI
jgi:hypothetical protein